MKRRPRLLRWVYWCPRSLAWFVLPELVIRFYVSMDERIFESPSMSWGEP